MTEEITPPRLAPHHPDTLIEAQQALELSFRNLVARAEAAGWETTIIITAITELADNYMLELEMFDRDQSAIEKLRKANDQH